MLLKFSWESIAAGLSVQVSPLEGIVDKGFGLSE